MNRFTLNKTKNVLVENEILKYVEAISTKGLSKDLINEYKILNGAKYFSSGIFQNYLLFVPAKKFIKYFNGTTRIFSWRSNGMLEESIELKTKSDRNFAPTLLIIINYQT